MLMADIARMTTGFDHQSSRFAFPAQFEREYALTYRGGKGPRHSFAGVRRGWRSRCLTVLGGAQFNFLRSSP